MAELKTKKNQRSVKALIDQVRDEQKRSDAQTILKIMKRITKSQPKMWGESIVGFGTYHYKYDSGREGDWFMTGFSPRKNNLTLYIMSGFSRYDELMKKLGKHKTGKSCLYINKLSDVDIDILAQLVAESVAHVRKSNT